MHVLNTAGNCDIVYWEGCILISTLHVFNTKGTLDEGYKYWW
jgi:hypothetical protein